MNPQRLYLDHAATTPCCRKAWEAMKPYFLTSYGNPNSIHAEGRAAREAVREARATIAALLTCAPSEIVFASGGTEANNLAIRGVLTEGRPPSHVVSTRIEHLSMIRTCESLAADGVEVTYVDVDRHGRVSPANVIQALRPNTALVTLSHANNEIGTIQPIGEIARTLKAERPDVLLHVDAVQTAGHIPISLNGSGIDLLTLTAHKFYGPKGIAALYVREGVHLKAVLSGGGEEGALRVGTESVGLVVGLATALQYATDRMAVESEYWRSVRDYVITELGNRLEECVLNGHPTERLATNVNVSFRGVSGEDLVLLLDRRGIAASTGSACTTGKVDPSHVLTVIGRSREEALGALRLSFGEACREVEPASLVSLLVSLVEEQRSTNYRPVFPGKMESSVWSRELETVS
jgi:cysteine desulfurase